MYLKGLTDFELLQVVGDENSFTKLKTVLEKISKDLQRLQTICRAEEVILEGGSVVSLLLGKEIVDWDITYKSAEPILSSQHCKKLINWHDMSILKDNIDIHNSINSIPWLTPTELAIGVYSFHTEYFRMFIIDISGRILTNIIAWNDFVNKIYRVNLGYFALLGFIKQKNKTMDNFYKALGYGLIRTIYYPHKYELQYAPESLHYIKSTLPFITKLYHTKGDLQTEWDQKAQSKGFKDFSQVIRTFQSFA